MNAKSTKTKGTKQSPEETRRNVQRGTGYLFLSVLIIALLAYVFPSVLNIDIRSFAQQDIVLGVARIAIGIAVIAYAIRACAIVVRINTLPGETWKRGLYNSLHTTLLGINGLTILLLFVGGAALIIWAITEML